MQSFAIRLLTGLVFVAQSLTLFLRSEAQETDSAAIPTIENHSSDSIRYGESIPTEQAIEFFRQRIRSADDYQNRSVLGRLLLRQAKESGDLTLYPQAEQILRQAHAVNPEHLATRLALADVMIANHDFFPAIESLQAAHRKDPSHFSVLAALGDAYLNVGQVDLANDFYQQLAGQSDAPAITCRLAHLDELHGRIESAVERLKQAVVDAERYDLTTDERAWQRWRLGSMCWSQGRFAEAQDHFLAALQLEPEHLAALIGSAQIKAASGQTEQAIIELNRIVNKTGDPPAIAMLVTLHAVQGDTDQALHRRTQADLAMAEEATVAAAAHFREYSCFLSDTQLRVDQALELARKDLERRPDIYSHDAMAWALYQNHDYVAAKQMIDRALQLGTRDATFHYHASKICQALNDSAAAKEHLQTSIQINPVVSQWAEKRLQTFQQPN